MRKRIDINKKIIILIIVILLLFGYYIYYKNSNIYNEFESSSNLEELLPYENNANIKTDEIEEKTKEEIIEEIILVHITGEIISPGVIELEKGARIIDAVNKANGFTENADTEKVNLAYELTDGVKIYIPSKIENKEENIDSPKYITADSGDNVNMEEKEMKKTEDNLVNINNATQTELESLPGIGPSTALKILSYREENGRFSNIEDIKNVSGIGDNKFENIRKLICI